MAWVTPTDVDPGDAILASLYNQDVVANAIAIRDAQVNVKQTVVTSAVSQTITTSYATISGMTVTITPSSATSKILVMCFATMQNNSGDARMYYRLTGGNAETFVGDAAGSRVRVAVGNSPDNVEHDYKATIIYLDSPATTSPVTYGLQARTSGGSTGIIFNRTDTDSDSTAYNRSASSITAMEIPV